jgi:hypothetical protein
VPPTAAAVPRADLVTTERALGAGAVMLMGTSLMAADTERFRRLHRFTHGADDRSTRYRAGGTITVTTYPLTAAVACRSKI